jgi:SAM-dependent methyltransferase
MKQTSDISFAPDWLALREPADHGARDDALLANAAKCVASGTTVLDLGSGTGSTVRAFERAGFDSLNWRLLDNDARLLSLATRRHRQALGIVGDLSILGDIPMDDIGLVTASALLDLMSRDWVEALARRLHAAHLPFYAALNYNGVMTWSPAQPDDEIVVGHFNMHQQRDKGTGPALGPTSGGNVARIFEDLGYQVSVAQSPWTIGPDQAVLHTQLLDGIVGAVAEIDDTLAMNWGDARKATVATSHVNVGHLDLLAVPFP